MSVDEIQALARRHHASVRSVYRWIEKGAPIDDDAALTDWLAQQRSRRGVSKFNKQTTDSAQTAIVPIVIERIERPAAAAELSAAEPSIDSPLARLEFAEKEAYQRYIQTGSKSDIQTWLAVNECLRRTQETLSQTKQVAAHDGRLISAILELIENWSIWFEVSMAKIVPMLCEGYNDRATVTEKLQHHFGLILYHAFADTHALVKDSPLEEIWRQYIKQKLGGKDPEEIQ